MTGPCGDQADRYPSRDFGALRLLDSPNHLFVEGRCTASEFSRISLLGGAKFLIPR
jgi:hypothetical protein